MELQETLNPLRKVKHRLTRRVRSRLLAAAKAATVRRIGESVASGPFSGMHFTDQDVHGDLMAKRLGTYELELTEALARLAARPFDRFINVGAAEGYYCVGAALRWEVREIVAFEATETGRELIAQIAKKNAVEANIAIRGVCRESDLFDLCSPEKSHFVLMDVEGAELELLSQRIVGRLERSSLVVEVHDFLVPGCRDEVMSRFKGSHHQEIIKSRMRGYRDFPCTLAIPAFLKLELMNERRPAPMEWLVIIPQAA